MIEIKNYPELKKITWFYNLEKIDEEKALRFYENHMEYIDFYNLTKNEKELINNLIEKFNNGISYF